jgi:cardiolipin synthase
MSELLTSVWPPLAATVQVLLAATASAHVVLHKRDVRAAIGWIGLIWLVPFAGSILYGLFGINRIRRRASELRASELRTRRPPAHPRARPAVDRIATGRHLLPIARLMDQVGNLPLSSGNAITPLVGGERAYAAMLEAIDGARRSLGLVTYIFDNDSAGARFIEALAAAVARGVAVRVLIDSVGARYSRPPATGLLRRRGVPTAEFLPNLVPLSLHYANLRNHHKILVVDGRVGFTGGMNIRSGHCTTCGPDAIQDIHFRLEGPIVGHLAEAFADDWAFATREQLKGENWFPALPNAGRVLARGIAAGPDEAFERIRWALLAALSQAKERVRVVTPYFLPDTALATSLQLAALRGVAIDIAIPERSNLRLVQWASTAKLLHLVARGCQIWRTAPPFDHSKLLTVDGLWSMIGSANWDQRSLRLNFEFNVECYDADFAGMIDGLIDGKLATARRMTAAELATRPLAVKLRDGAAWLLSPYL